MRQKPSSDYAEHRDPCLAGNAAFLVISNIKHVKHCSHAALGPFLTCHTYSLLCISHVSMLSMQLIQLDHLCAEPVSNVIYSNLLGAPLIPEAIRPSQNVNRCCSIQCLQPIRLLWYICPTDLCQLGVVRPLIHWHDVCLQQYVVLYFTFRS